MQRKIFICSNAKISVHVKDRVLQTISESEQICLPSINLMNVPKYTWVNLSYQHSILHSLLGLRIMNIGFSSLLSLGIVL